MKVYITFLQWDDWYEKGNFSCQVHDTREKAQETLEKWKQEELMNSWINEIEDLDELENYADELEYFDCCQYDRRTTIWIEEKVVE